MRTDRLHDSRPTPHRIARELAFFILQLLLGPLQAMAYAIYRRRLVTTQVPLGVSGSAYEPFFYRMLLQAAGTRPDVAAGTLAGQLPAMSPTVARVLRSLGAGARICGVQQRLFAFPVAPSEAPPTVAAHRTAFFDTVLAATTAASTTVKQLVILGSGWDTRAYGELPAGDLQVFEVDREAMVAAKRDALARARIRSEHVTFVAADLRRPEWLGHLIEHRFDPNLPTLVLCEGVTMYLDDSSVASLLAQVACLPVGSAVAFDFLSRELVLAQAPFEILGRHAQATANSHGRGLSFGVSTRTPAKAAVTRLAGAAGLELVRYEPLGETLPPVGGLVVAARPC